MNSEKRPTKLSMKTVTRIGSTKRKVIVKKMRAWLAPSTFAASSNSLGTVSK